MKNSDDRFVNSWFPIVYLLLLFFYVFEYPRNKGPRAQMIGEDRGHNNMICRNEKKKKKNSEK